jgi:spore coat polysaccharide biosynthesis protein SpsF
MLSRVIERAAAIPGLGGVVVALPADAADDPLAELAERAGAAVFRGDPTDVLDRVYRAARGSRADVVVRVTADCPLLDPEVSGRVLAALAPGASYASNVHPPTFPDGLDTEAVAMDALEAAWREATLASDREHVTPYIWRQPERFGAANVAHSRDLSAMRWTVDETDDLPFVEGIAGALDAKGLFGFEQVLAVLEMRPDLAALAAAHARNEGYAASLKGDHGV